MSILALGIAFWWVKWERLRTVLAQADYALLAAGLCLQLVPYFLQGWRWHILLRTDGKDWPFWRVQTVNYSAMFFDLFTPGRLGSDACRVMSFNERGRAHRMVSVLVALRFQGIVASLIFLAVVGVVYVPWDKIAVYAVATVVSILFVAMLIRKGYQPCLHGLRIIKGRGGFIGIIAGHILLILEAFNEVHGNLNVIVTSTLLALIFVLMSIAIYALVGAAFHINLKLSNYLLVVPLLMVASSVPVTIQGRGLTEILAIMLWQGPGVGPEQILLTCLGVYALGLLHGMASGVAWFFTVKRR